ncbi:MAG: hypothetical protein HC881_22200 [Leptolyngbyaceae cyanobacterium SL_7_1]|nr:hypothetical protein [Leptolyngbyaceae cyanobacterium SL_7_1]
MEEFISDIDCTVPVPASVQELEQAIWHYKNTDLSGDDLFCQWQAIRTGALSQRFPEPEGDRVGGEDSY